MSNISLSYIIVFFCVICLSAGQIMFKLVSSRITTIYSLVGDFSTAAIFVAALILYGVSTLAWLIALKTIPLSQAYLFMALGFVAVPFAAHFIFEEPIGRYQLVGTLFVLVGLVIATR